MNIGTKVFINFKTLKTVGTVISVKEIDDTPHYQLQIDKFPDNGWWWNEKYLSEIIEKA